MKKLLLLSIYLLLTSLGFSQENKVQMHKATNVKKTTFGNEETSANKSLTSSTARGSAGGGTVNGSIVADLSVSSTGGVNYSVPINVPPGLNGIQPEISLDFDSQSGNGLAGWGWNVSGISVITRIPSTLFHDNQIDPVDFDLDDRFALDGQRLIVKSGTYGASGSVYQTEQYSNLKIVAYGSGPVTGVQGPEYFKVFYPDGSIGHYGTTPNSRSHTDYAITHWENPQGIRISYEYQTSNNTLRVDKIKYGSTGTTTSINEIEFTYVYRRFHEMAYVGGVQFVRGQKLISIKVLGNGNQYRKYNLTHNSQTHLRYDRLTRITELGGDSFESRKIEFEYDGISVNPAGGVNDLHTASFNQNSGVAQINLNDTEQRNAAVVSLDYTGDGKMDFIVYPTTGVDKKRKFWLYSDIQSSINYSSAVNVDLFKAIFPVNWLDDQNKLRSSQALALVQNTGNTQVKFNVMAEVDPASGVAIGTKYTKTWNAPSIQYSSSCSSTIDQRIQREYLSGDFDGDGLSDIMALSKGHYSSNYCYSSGSGGCYCDDVTTLSPRSAHLIRLDRRLPSTSGFTSFVGSLQASIGINDKLLAMDVTGDGRTNIVHITAGKVTVYGLNKTNTSLVKLWETADSRIDLDFPPLSGDYNGDGKGDLLLPIANNSRTFLMLLSNGTDYHVISSTRSFMFRFSYYSGGTYYGHNLIPADVNGDGKTDITEYNTQVNNNSTTGTQSIRVHQNVVVNTTSVIYPYFYPSNSTNSTVNMETYPIPIFLSSDKPNSNLEFASISDRWVRSYEFLKDHREDVTMKQIINNGVTTTIKYDHVNTEYYDTTEPYFFKAYSAPSPSYSQTYPFVNINVSPSFKVVRELEQAGAGLTRKQQFYYEKAVSHATGLGFMGFEVMKRSNWYGDGVGTLWTITKHDPLLRGAVTEQLVANTSSSNPAAHMSKINYFYDYKLIANPGSPVAPQYQTSYDIDYSIPGSLTRTAEESIFLLPGFYADGSNGTFLAEILPPNEQPGDTGYAGAVDIRLNRMESDNGLTGVFTTQTYTYDTYNNPLAINTVFPGGSRVVSNEYYNNASATTTYHIGRVKKMTEKVTLNGNTFSTEEQYAYNNNLVTQVKKKGNGTDWVIEDFTHDSYGNVKTRTLTSGGKVRTEEFEYNPALPYGGRFLTKSIDIEGLKTEYTYYTDTGSLMSVTDPYGLKTSYLYDKWDRVEKKTDYLTQETFYAYVSLQDGELKNTVDYPDGGKEETIYNAFGWMTKAGSLSLNNQWVYKSYEYDVSGRVKRESEPHNGSPGQWNTSAYDEYGRPISQSLYTGRNITYTYSGLSAIVNDGIKSVTTTSDALGNTVKVQDPGGTVDYIYFANGTLKTADYGGNVVSVGIDGWGRKTSLNDPSAGSYSYTYNEFGELLTESTPKGITTNAYDNNGKLTGKTIVGDFTDLFLTYEYHTTTTKLLKKITGTDNTNSGRAYSYDYTYDTYQRPYQIVENTGKASFTYKMEFDGYGRVEKETQTSSLTNGASKIVKTKNVYDSSGILKEIWNDDGTLDKLWELNQINARGQALTVTLGNGMTKTRTYDAYGYLEKIEDKESGTNPTKALHTEYDFNVQRGTLNSRENFGFNWQESFGYDNLDRLKTIAGNVAHTMAYKSNGNIDSNTALGSYEYGDTSKKYRLTEIDPNTAGETYFQQHPTQQISYNAFKKPIDIHQTGHGRVSFEYGPLMNRSTAYYGGEDADRSLRRYRKHYSAIIPVEIVEDTQTGTTKIVTYVGGDAYTAPIAHIKTTGTGAVDEYHYLHRDYLGSILAITDADGDVKEERQFGAWGTVDKFLDSATGTTFDHTALLGRGYTGHEHFFEVSLIHMNGRMYDALLGRFLSPDNYIQEPFNTQSYNRYGYVLNNPLMYTDPSGEFFFGGGEFALLGWIIGALVTTTVLTVGLNNGWFDGGSAYAPTTFEDVAPVPRSNPSNTSTASSIASNKPRQSTGGPGINAVFNGFKHLVKEYVGGSIEGHKRFVEGTIHGITQGIPYLMKSSFLANGLILNGDFREGFGIHKQNTLNLGKGLISPITQIGDAFGYALEGNIFEAQANITEALDGIGLAVLSGGTAGVGTKSISGLSRLSRSAAKGSRSLASNPFKGKTFSQVDEMFKAKGFTTKGPSPLTGKGSYFNPKTGTRYYLDKGGMYKKGFEGPHIDIWYNGHPSFEKVKYFLDGSPKMYTPLR